MDVRFVHAHCIDRHGHFETTIHMSPGVVRFDSYESFKKVIRALYDDILDTYEKEEKQWPVVGAAVCFIDFSDDLHWQGLPMQDIDYADMYKLITKEEANG